MRRPWVRSPSGPPFDFRLGQFKETKALKFKTKVIGTTNFSELDDHNLTKGSSAFDRRYLRLFFAGSATIKNPFCTHFWHGTRALRGARPNSFATSVAVMVSLFRKSAKTLRCLASSFRSVSLWSGSPLFPASAARR